MTEYTSNSEAIQEYMSARERTALWVRGHAPNGAVPAFVPPSSPPSMISDSDAPSYGPSDSDEESNHSLPPRMVLRYGDGRPDIPISTDYDPHSGIHSGMAPRMRSTAPQASLAHRRSKSGSHAQHPEHAPPYNPPRHAQSLSYASQHAVQPMAMPEPPRSPESIVVLPSRESSQNTQSTTNAAPNAPPPTQNHVPYSPTLDAAMRVPLPQSTVSQIPQRPSQFGGTSRISSQHPSHHGIAAPSPRRAFDPSQIPVRASSPQITHSQSQPLPAPMARAATSFAPHPPSSRVHSQLPYTYSPPAIVYAPSSKHSRSHYAPPAIVYSPAATRHDTNTPSRHAPSITYSQSAPLPQSMQHSRAGSHGYHPAQGSLRSHHPRSTIPEEDPRVPRGHDTSMEQGHSRSRSRGPRSHTPADSVMYIDDRELPPANDPSEAFSYSEDEDENDQHSRASGSTYYVLPTPGQKVKLIGPNSGSIYTATSTTKSGHSPRSGHSGPKKPFFQRIFSIPKLSGSSSSSDGPGKRVSRRHTIGGAHIQGRVGLPPR